MVSKEVDSERIDRPMGIEIGGVKLKNPIILEAGPMTRDGETIKKAVECGAGAVVTKSIAFQVAKVPRPCIAKIPGGMLNAELWSDLEYEDWVEREIKLAKQGGAPIIACIYSLEGKSEEFSKLARGVTEAGADLIEFAAFNAKKAQMLIRAARRTVDTPIIMKVVASSYEISQDVPVWNDVLGIGRAAQRAGAAAVAVSDSLGPCLSIDIRTGKPLMGSLSGTGGISGPAMKPFVNYYVYRLAQTINIPIIGVGGVMNGDDAIETVMAGATGVGVCTAAILSGPKVLGKIVREMQQYMQKMNISSLDEIRGIAVKNIEDRKRKGEVITEGKTPAVSAESCNACKLCERICPYNAITVTKVPTFNALKCYGCGLCSTACPTKAISLRY